MDERVSRIIVDPRKPLSYAIDTYDNASLLATQDGRAIILHGVRKVWHRNDGIKTVRHGYDGNYGYTVTYVDSIGNEVNPRTGLPAAGYSGKRSEHTVTSTL